MRKKVKKFGIGGDIVTGLGAVLVGKALYDKYKSKDDEESDYARKVKEFRSSKEDTAKPTEESKTTKAEPKEETREEYLAKKVKPIKETGTFAGPDTTEPDLEYKSKPATKKATPAAQPKKTVPAVQPKKVESKPAPVTTPDNDSRPSKPYPKGVKGTTTDPYLRPSLGLGLDERQQARKSYLSRIAAEAKEKTDAEAKAKAEKRKGASETNYDEMGNPIMKRGGAVKKYASGGTVKSSASKRADGIAQRGKTRGRIC